MRSFTFGLALLAACASGGSDPSFSQLVGGSAAIKLSGSSALVTLTSDTAWTLAKTGTTDAASSTVTWTITATQGQTVSGHLVLTGTMTVTNTGTGPATIGNIVANLQVRAGNKWVSASADIADGTHGDAATTAYISPTASSENKSFFAENAASGSLQFTDASTNTIFSLTPEVAIAPGATTTLLFSASYDNNVLGLAPGTPIRAEIIVSFGNAVSNPSSTPNVDINGNGVIDPDEARVRSVPTRLGLTVPAQQPGNATVTLSDALSDLATTGTVTFSNPSFNLGATSGTVSVHYDGGTSGGTLTNCAHLTSTDGLNLLACNTQTIGGHTCTPGAPGCGWETGDVVTYSQVDWGSVGSTAAALLAASFNAIYPAGLEVGIAGTAGFSMLFADSASTIVYLPASGSPGALNADLINPTSSSSGLFGGLVLAVQLDVDFSDANLLGGSVHFGDLLLCGLTTTPSLNGITVRQFLAIANTALGGGSAPYPIDPDLASLAFDLGLAFEDGAPSTFAQDHLFTGSCPP